MNWAEVGVPDYIIKHQTAWDRGNSALRAVDSGVLTIPELASKMGLSYERTRQILIIARRRVGKKHPIECWLVKGTHNELTRLSKMKAINV